MHLRRYISIGLIVALLLMPLWFWLAWAWGGEKELKVLILDKTVLNKQTQEHASLNWLLNQRKYTTDSSALYKQDKDYFGFFPDEKGGYTINDFAEYSDTLIDSLSYYYDMAYYADLYGVYRSEWYATYPEVAPDSSNYEASERSRLIYGGMKKQEFKLLKRMKERQKLIITEFNIIASPTSYSVRRMFEEEFNVYWSGWVGRYFNSLDTSINKELPPWLTENYMVQNDGNWPFTNSGIAFVSWNDTIVILENQTHLETELPIIKTNGENALLYNVPKEMKYPFWFDVCYYKDPNIAVSNYTIETNSTGDSILNRYRIPAQFPAVITAQKGYPFYYFAGDFADNPISVGSAQYKNIHWFSSLTYSSSVEERNSFFWDYYRPLMNKILDSYDLTLQQNLKENESN